MLKAQLIPHLDQMSHSIKTQRVGIFIYSFPAKNQRCEPTNRVTTVAVGCLTDELLYIAFSAGQLLHPLLSTAAPADSIPCLHTQTYPN